MSEEPNVSEQAVHPSGLRGVLALLDSGRSLQVGDLEVDEDGHLRVRSGDQPLRFAFAFRGADFLAQIETSPATCITLSAELGKVPYSMEKGVDRRLTQRIIEATSDLPSGRIEVSESQDMSLAATAQPPSPLTPASIMAAIASLLLDFGPYIDLLRESLLAASDLRGPAAAATSPTASSPPEPPPEPPSEP